MNYFLTLIKDKLNNNKVKDKKYYLNKWENDIKKFSSIHAVTDTSGYKEVYKHFETILNSQIRDKNVNFDYLQGVEDVFNYFENAKNVVIENENNIKKYKDAK
ncbi:MAG: hypothetical protein BWY74_00349 [Firmicutes bacterium ADurb.Bin419]|nr:MAG: hypothetical protein BWY74_00349 [Firmicutes bacterium ADurb.Bin419]